MRPGSVKQKMQDDEETRAIRAQQRDAAQRGGKKSESISFSTKGQMRKDGRHEAVKSRGNTSSPAPRALGLVR